MSELTFSIDNASVTPLYEQIYEYIKTQIKQGQIQCGFKLPSSRSLSKHLQVSRSTVDMAYSQLVAEGYIYSVSYKGYFVSEVSLLYNVKDSKRYEQKYSVDDEKWIYDFTPRGIDMEHFPFSTWRKLYKNILSYDNMELFLSGDKQGEYSLRKTLSNYLYQTRGFICSPEQVIIGAGSEYLIMLLSNILDKNKKMIFENPTYPKFYKMFTSFGYSVEAVDIDENGLIVDKIKKGVDYVYCTPTHQFPTGAIMSINRRNELLSWANEKEERYIIEDDYNSDFRYKGRPIPALLSLDTNEKVIYLGTLSRSIAPGIRMSYMILPKRLMKIYHNRLEFMSSTVSRIDQQIVNDFISGGYYERHLNKMRSLYRTKHDLLINELKKKSDKLVITGDTAGMHIIIDVKSEFTIEELKALAQKAKIKINTVEDYKINSGLHFNSNLNVTDNKTFILGFAKLNSLEIQKGTDLLLDTWQLNK